MKEYFKTPILFLIFNRPDTTQRVFDVIRQVKPKQLFIAADGPRIYKEGEAKKCEDTRNIIKQIDWDCEVKTLFRDENLGCGKAVSGAITWFFENVEEGIILEDDCLPALSFFEFCQEMLEKYREDTRIMMISGFNKQNKWNSDKYDYFFSNLGSIWGWATWRRSWVFYDIKMESLDVVLKSNLLKHLLGYKNGKIRETQFLMVKYMKIDTWDYQWSFCRNINSGMSCVPSKNLVENIGFGINSTHTKNIKKYKFLLNNLDFPLRNNNLVVVDKKYDDLFFSDIVIRFLIMRIRIFIKNII